MTRSPDSNSGGFYQDEHGYTRYSGDGFDRVQLERALLRSGRVNAPAALCDLVIGKSLDLARTDMVGIVAGVWSGAEYPERALGRYDWREYFRVNGYTRGEQAAARPTGPITLYRGCLGRTIYLDATDKQFEVDENGWPLDPDEEIFSEFDTRRGMAWTSDLETARRFAFDRLRGRALGQVYTLTVPPEHLLAHITDRDESEYIVDPEFLDHAEIELYESERPE